MDSQTISVIIGVIGAAIAALGLLLAWYRGDRSKTPPSPDQSPPGPWYRRIRTRHGMAIAAATAVAVLTGVGVLLVIVSPAAPPPDQAAPLTEAQYRSELTRACVDADEEAQRIAETEPANTVFGANINVERHLVDRLRGLVPPKSLRAAHDDLIGTWDRRLAILDSIYLKLRRPDTDVQDADVQADLAVATELAAKVTELSKSVDVPQCGFE
jgi:hypothetical protein